MHPLDRFDLEPPIGEQASLLERVVARVPGRRRRHLRHQKRVANPQQGVPRTWKEKGKGGGMGKLGDWGVDIGFQTFSSYHY